MPFFIQYIYFLLTHFSSYTIWSVCVHICICLYIWLEKWRGEEGVRVFNWQGLVAQSTPFKDHNPPCSTSGTFILLCLLLTPPPTWWFFLLHGCAHWVMMGTMWMHIISVRDRDVCMFSIYALCFFCYLLSLKLWEWVCPKWVSYERGREWGTERKRTRQITHLAIYWVGSDIF